MENEIILKYKLCDNCGEKIEQNLQWYPLLSRWLCRSCYIRAGQIDLRDIQGGKYVKKF